MRLCSVHLLTRMARQVALRGAGRQGDMWISLAQSHEKGSPTFSSGSAVSRGYSYSEQDGEAWGMETYGCILL